MTEILYDRLTRDQLHAYCLVLDAYGLSYAAEVTAQGGRIMVEPEACEAARDLVQQYIRENAESVPLFAAPAAAPHPQKTYSAFWICLVLVAAHVAIQSADDVDALVQAYGASAARILQGELYRTVTALMIHADAAHLAGNLAGLAFLGTWVGRTVGPGLGWLAILLSGMAGNLANALFFRQGHLSIGASTAVFGALGFLAALHFHRKLKSERRDERRKAWLPLAGGVALLGFMGTSVHSDLMAHLFGMAIGICLGLLYALGLQPLVQPRHQVWAMVLVAAIAALSWLRPI